MLMSCRLLRFTRGGLCLSLLSVLLLHLLVHPVLENYGLMFALVINLSLKFGMFVKFEIFIICDICQLGLLPEIMFQNPPTCPSRPPPLSYIEDTSPRPPLCRTCQEHFYSNPKMSSRVLRHCQYPRIAFGSNYLARYFNLYANTVSTWVLCWNRRFICFLSIKKVYNIFTTDICLHLNSKIQRPLPLVQVDVEQDRSENQAGLKQQVCFAPWFWFVFLSVKQAPYYVLFMFSSLCEFDFILIR